MFWLRRWRVPVAASELEARKDRRETTVQKEILDRRATLGLLDHKVCKAFKNPKGPSAAKG